jgi:hypothetical protein
MPKSKMPNPTVVLRNLRGDADETLVERGRAEVLKEMRAARAVRDRERKVMRQFQAATDA